MFWLNLAYKVQILQGLNQPFSLRRIVKDGVSLVNKGLHLPFCDESLKILYILDFPDKKWYIWPDFPLTYHLCVVPCESICCLIISY